MLPRRLNAFLALAAMPGFAAAAESGPGGGIEVRLSGAATAGTMIRTESPDPAVLGTQSTARIGHPPGQLGGNAGGSDLNFRRGRPVSTVAKLVADLEIRRDNLGVFLRAKAWHDFELEDGDRPYGNTLNGFRQNAPLSDRGFDPAARFSNARLADAFAFGRFPVGDGSSLDLRAGRQVVNWGVAQLVGGGVNAVNPLDLPAQGRPGALPQEGKVPVGMVYANLAGSQDWGMDGFVQYEFRPTVLPGCGTFFITSNFLPTGCNYASVLGSVDDATALAAGAYPKRSPDVDARDSGQFGLSLRYKASALSTEMRAYALNYHNRTPNVRVTNPNIAGGYGAGALTRLIDPDGVRYGVVYAEDIRLYGLSFDTRLDASTRVTGELAYRPNQPINFNTSDLIAAFLGRSPTSALNLARNTNAIAPGGTFDSYDRFKVTTAILGGSKAFPRALGAAEIVLRGEIGWSHVAGLPDPGTLRYGRSDDYGVAAINGISCTETTAARKSCAHDGFVTAHAWGYRLALSATYPGAFLGADLIPSLGFAHDVSGYSHDGAFLQGRRTLRPAVHARWGKGYFADLRYTAIAGGAYNTQVDRDHLTLSVGTSF
jgi:hypothetical protein